MAPGGTNAERTGAVIVFADETALSLPPPVRATWAPRGHTPTLRVRMGKRPKTSLVGWCCHPPDGPPKFLYRMVPGSVTDRESIRQLPDVHRTFARPIVLVWDNLGSRRSRRMQAFAERVDGSTLVFLPPYSPDLDPVEGSWAHLKSGALANLGARTLEELVSVARQGLRHLQRHPALLNGFLAATDLT
ncbi:transposase [Streptomyces sp. SID3343]|uniref:transposase n=1 Tax=Streptomyces sp. SID3343 TaxID=2690260 RepID=UPI001370162B|nr:IS630 family transposase [Streptomyces sp. SID3343]